MDDRPIVESLLDTDFYKFTMGQLVWQLHRSVPVAYEFQNRHARIRLADEVDVGAVREELEHVRSLSFTNQEIAFLRRQMRSDGKQVFGDDYLQFLWTLRLPKCEVAARDGQLEIRATGAWSQAIYWETIVLCVVNELRARRHHRQRNNHERNNAAHAAYASLMMKVGALLDADARIADFGTRRRFSRSWQERVDAELSERLSQQFIGTSNVANAMAFCIKPIGTMAHELPMAYAALAGDDNDLLADAPYAVMRDWRAMYGKDLSIGLPDTFGSKDFLRCLPVDMLREWNGFRQDSGSPNEFADDLIRAYQSVGVDPRNKSVVFSDGLDLPAMQELCHAYHARIIASFGWGTNLTFDWPDIAPVSIVMKLAEVGCRRTVKLSDNPAKAMGPADEVARYKRVFNYDQTEHPSVECRV